MKSRLNYSTWKTNNQAILEDLSDKKVMVPYSGGKDSSADIFVSGAQWVQEHIVSFYALR